MSGKQKQPQPVVVMRPAFEWQASSARACCEQSAVRYYNETETEPSELDELVCRWCKALISIEVKVDNPTFRRVMRAAGRIRGAIGGHARAANLSPERRKEIAQKAAAARWHPNGATR